MPRRPNVARDLKIAQFIENYTRAHGYPPTHRQIQKSLRIDHLFTVQRSLARLKASVATKSRASSTTIPLVGYVAAGSPIEAIENAQPLEVPAWMMKKSFEYFVLRVKGNSMIEDGIFDDDLVLIRKQAHAKDGDTVVALVNNEATLKKFYKKSEHVILRPANSELADIKVGQHQDFRIAGIYAGVLRGLE